MKRKAAQDAREGDFTRWRNKTWWSGGGYWKQLFQEDVTLIGTGSSGREKVF